MKNKRSPLILFGSLSTLLVASLMLSINTYADESYLAQTERLFSDSDMTIDENYIFSNLSYEDLTSNIIFGSAILNTATLSVADGVSLKFESNEGVYGAVYNQGTMDLGDNVIFLNNKVYNYSSNQVALGGAIMNKGSLTIGDNAYFEGNTSAYYGGAIYTEGAMTIGDNAQFISNNAYYRGGAIYIYAEGETFDISNAYFYDNKVFSTTSGFQGYGGAIYLSEGTLNLSKSIFEANISSYCGGAINTGTVPTNNFLNVSDSIFTGNVAGAAGGAIGSYFKTIITNTIFDSNEAGVSNTTYYNGGGAIFLGGCSEIEISYSTFTNNQANVGGAISITQSGLSDTVDVALSISNSIFDGNYASKQGGAIYNSYRYNGTNLWGTTVTDTTFINNSAKEQGGAIYNLADHSALAGNSGYITIASTSGNNILNLGNYASGDDVIDANDDANGGFLYMGGSSTSGYYATAVFDTEENSSITIGDGTAGYDSIASADDAALIVKQGEGDLIVNSSMEHYLGTLIVEEGSMYVNSDLNTSYLSVSKDANLSVSGGTITGDVSLSGTLTLSTNSEGVLASFSQADVNGVGTIIIKDSATMISGKTYVIADDYTLENYSEVMYTALALSADDISSGSGLLDLVITEDGLVLTFDDEGNLLLEVESTNYFSNLAEGSNEEEISSKVDGLVSGDNDEAIIELKQNLATNGISSYIMDNFSYIAEVNTMLLTNQNFANVNRARDILSKSANAKTPVVEDNNVSVENEDGAVVVDANELPVSYSNVAQLQSINFLGSKDASNGVAGYDYWSVGATANFDKILSENALVGASMGGTYNKVSGDAGDNASSTTFLLNAYSAYAYENFELFANIGYAHFWNDGSKYGEKASWDSDAFNFLAGVAYKMETTLEGLTINPLAMLNLVYIHSDSANYSNGVDISAQSYMSAKLMLGFEVEYAITAQFNAIARIIYAHECGDSSYDYTYSIGGIMNGLNYLGGEAGKDTALMGLGLSYDISEQCALYFDYNAYAYSNLITHSLNFSLALKF